MKFQLSEKAKTRATLIGLATAYTVLVVMLIIYERNVTTVLSQRFDNSVRRSLVETAREVEEQDMLNIIDDIAHDTTEYSQNARLIINNADNESISNLLFGHKNPSSINNISPGSTSRDNQSSRKLREARELMLQVLAHKYEAASSHSISERINPVFLRETLSETLTSNGITDSFSFVVVCRHSGIIEHFGEKPFDFKAPHSDIYEQTLFRRDVNDRPFSLIVKVNGKRGYIYRYTWMVLPILICMTILLALLIYLIHHTVKSQRLTKIQKAFVKNMTHELKTPVASISLASEMLSDPTLHFSPETYAAKCKIINTEAKRLTGIIERVLQTSVLEQKHIKYNTDPVNLNEIVTTARESFLLKVQQKSPGSRIILHLNADRPVIYADRMHITNVVYNLMDNALKYCDPSRPLILEIVTRNVDDRLFIDFTDNGIGIKPEHLKHIFDKFYRVPTGDRHDVKGFGLGLNYVRHVVTHNGGNITVQSRFGVGSRFTFDFQAFRS